MFGKKNTSHPHAIKLEVLDLETNISTTYFSVREAAKALNLEPSIISNYFNRKQIKPYKGRYVFKNIALGGASYIGSTTK